MSSKCRKNRYNSQLSHACQNPVLQSQWLSVPWAGQWTTKPSHIAHPQPAEIKENITSEWVTCTIHTDFSGGHLGCDALWACIWGWVFQRNMLPPSSGLKPWGRFHKSSELLFQLNSNQHSWNTMEIVAYTDNIFADKLIHNTFKTPWNQYCNTQTKNENHYIVFLTMLEMQGH
jgi:hypothetical protein